jgi:Haem-degrading
MKNPLVHARGFITAISVAAMSGILVAATVPAADAPRPIAPPTALSLREARVIIDGAVAYARDKKLTMTVVILDEEGQLISADRMEGASFHLERFAKGRPLLLSYCATAPKRQPSYQRPAPIATSAS